MNEIKFNDISKTIVEIETSSSYLNTLVATYKSNSSGIVHHLDNFINNYKLKMLEDKMLKYLDTRFIGSKSLVETYIEQVVINEANDFVLTKSSTNKIIYELYLTVLLAVSKGHALLDIALRMREFYSEGNIFCFFIQITTYLNLQKYIKKIVISLKPTKKNILLNLINQC